MILFRWFLEKLGHEGLNKMLDGFDGECSPLLPLSMSHITLLIDRSAYAMCIFSFCEGLGHEVVQFVGTTDGRIVEARGPKDFGCGSCR